MAGRSPLPLMWVDTAPSMVSCMASPRRRGPCCLRSSAMGTLPLRNPFMAMPGWASRSLAGTLASSSSAVTVTV